MRGRYHTSVVIGQVPREDRIARGFNRRNS